MNYFISRGCVYQRFAVVPNFVWLRRLQFVAGRMVDCEAHRIARDEFDAMFVPFDAAALANLDRVVEERLAENRS